MLDFQLYQVALAIHEERLKEAALQRSYRERNPLPRPQDRLRRVLSASLRRLEEWITLHRHTPGGAMPMGGGAHSHG